MANITINIDTTQKILLKRKLNKNGEAQKFFTSEVKRLSDPYVPLDNDPLKTTARVDTDKITYIQPYAKYQWYGKVMAGNPRRTTSKNLKYNGAPMRGPKWTLRMWGDRGNEIVESVASFVGGKAK